MIHALPALTLLLATAQPAELAPVVRNGLFFAHDGSDMPDSLRLTDVIPLRTGQCYAWALQVEPEQRSVAIREVFDLPAPGNWNTGGENQTSAVARNQRTAVTEFQAPLGDGLITHGWCVAEGDPAGPHRIRVYHGETLLRDFRFSLVPESH